MNPNHDNPTSGEPGRYGGAPTTPTPVLPPRNGNGGPANSNGQPTTYIAPEERPPWQAPPLPAAPQAPMTPQPPVAPRRVAGRQDMTGPMILILLGGFFLLSNFGWLDGNIWGSIWRLWPLALVAGGLSIVFGRSNPMASSIIWLGALVLGILMLFAGGFATSGAWGGILLLMLLGLVVLGLTAWGYFSGARNAAPAGEWRAVGGGSSAATPSQPAGAAAARSSGALLKSSVTMPLGSATAANVRVDYGAGALAVRSSGGGSDLASADFTFIDDWGEPTFTTEMVGSTLNFHLKQKAPEGIPWPMWDRGLTEGPNWDVRLNPSVPLALVVKTGASKVDLDLEQLRLSRLDLDLGASNTTITMPANAGRTTAVIHGGAMSCTIYVPATVAVGVNSKVGLASVTVDSRVARAEVAGTGITNRLDLDIEIGVASVRILPKQ